MQYKWVHTVIHMGNDRHITNIVLAVHNTAKLFRCELHLQTTKISYSEMNKQLTKLQKLRIPEAKFLHLPSWRVFSSR